MFHSPCMPVFMFDSKWTPGMIYWTLKESQRDVVTPLLSRYYNCIFEIFLKNSKYEILHASYVNVCLILQDFNIWNIKRLFFINSYGFHLEYSVLMDWLLGEMNIQVWLSNGRAMFARMLQKYQL
jgi:hypothetical protein